MMCWKIHLEKQANGNYNATTQNTSMKIKM